MAEQLTDETWQALDPYAGRLSSRQARRLAAVVLALVLVVLGGTAVNLSGLVTPRLHALPPGGSWGAAGVSDPPMGLGPRPASARADRQAGTIHHFTWVLNNSWYAVRVERVEADIPGLELVEVSGFETPLRHREQRGVDLVFRITDCRAVPADSWPIRLAVDRAWSSTAATLEVGGYPGGLGAPSNGQLIDRVCAPG